MTYKLVTKDEVERCDECGDGLWARGLMIRLLAERDAYRRLALENISCFDRYEGKFSGNSVDEVISRLDAEAAKIIEGGKL